MGRMPESDREFDETIAAYDANAAAYVARNRALGYWVGPSPRVQAFAALLPAGARVLDAGCGPAHDTVNLRAAGCLAIGLDRSAGMLAQARAQHGADLPLLQGDLRQLPIAAGAFDGVFMMASLLHLPRAAAPLALAEAWRVLVAGGVLYVSVKRGQGVAVTDTAVGVRRYTLYAEDELAALLADAGYRAVGPVPGLAAQEGWVNLLGWK
jgi:ubiquinone/menaquinone biosynthesis C-methylase UbiE